MLMVVWGWCLGAEDWGRFKATSLRNIELSAPYMMSQFRFGSGYRALQLSVKHRNLDPRLGFPPMAWPCLRWKKWLWPNS